MTTSVLSRPKQLPLTTRVYHAERRVLDRRRIIGVRLSALRLNLRKQLSSPKILLVAGCLGFAAGQFIGLKARATSSAASAVNGVRASSYKQVLRRALKVIAVARGIWEIIPSSTKDTEVRSESTKQRPVSAVRSAEVLS